ncbi:trophoblast Kunitz domain protein 1-like [Bubalus kerabau]|uniref:trophoblast Kunitz domain protein 1-like n=1 Tax=Bubalus carabanensis TaxID=3119969 RepID=UPI00244EF2F9|nr:trophoblast Kunitz domain protein 1-like [Bubalus carabanensis]
MKMNCLCLSAALLFLLVILVDGTPVYEHHSLDQGEELISLRQLENHTLQEFPTHILEEENKDSQPAFCLEPKLAGSCKNKTARYFYNAKTGCCEPFVYGGCEGNKNNFNTIDNCLKSCCPDCMKTCCTLEESQGGHVKSGP